MGYNVSIMVNGTLFQVTRFRHGIRTSEEIMDIINYLEGRTPGSRMTASDAIRFAISSTAIEIRQDIPDDGDPGKQRERPQQS